MKEILNFKNLIDDYEIFIFDQYGVLHNGIDINYEVEKSIKEIKNKGKKFIILSNSGKTKEVNYQRIIKMGSNYINKSNIITSGEIFRDFFINEKYPFNNLGKKYFILGQDSCLLNNTKYLKCESIKDSDFLLLATLDNNNLNDNLKFEIENGVKNKKILICVNPDKYGILGEKINTSVGAIASEYKNKGGYVEYIGKPYLNTFNYILDLFKPIDNKKMLMIGDSLNTDIKGAFDVDIDSLFLISGIHKNDFKTFKNKDIKKKILEITNNKFQPIFFSKEFKY